VVGSLTLAANAEATSTPRIRFGLTSRMPLAPPPMVSARSGSRPSATTPYYGSSLWGEAAHLRDVPQRELLIDAVLTDHRVLSLDNMTW